MKKSRKVKSVLLRRKKSGRTNYKKRITLLKSGGRRLVIRRSLNNLVAQVVEYSPEGDRIITSASSRELEKYGYKFSKGNLVAAYLTGLLIGRKSKKKGITDAILDMGLYQSTKGSRIYAAVKGAVDAGMKIPCSPEVFPKEERIKGLHIKTYAENIKKDSARYNKQFSSYIKSDASPEKISEAFEEIKSRIMKE
ncbi:50S ribosomal protein L18 [Candidatus Woesearchaeota archaeon CG10_big_fil_rev_8_21_14_0_10_44_13]|nr:MAG: 50S ribosomal protein L18 [Candidatus Woesearchaeota archaeon CG10_big_fil_rev_8_21_14_0_10_44_13]